MKAGRSSILIREGEELIVTLFRQLETVVRRV